MTREEWNKYQRDWLKTPKGREYQKKRNERNELMRETTKALKAAGLNGKALGTTVWREGYARKLGVFANEQSFYKHNGRHRHL